MESGEISGNSASFYPSYGGGVYVAGTFAMRGGEVSGNDDVEVYVGIGSNGRFTMSGGKISGNLASGGGGVYVYSGGTFTMRGGKISGNSASYGGGVYVSEGYGGNGTFTKRSDGIIYGSDADDTLKNTATGGDGYGHAVYVYYISSSSGKIRNTAAGTGVTLDSSVNGSSGGWE
jgi:hypothetical protein